MQPLCQDLQTNASILLSTCHSWLLMLSVELSHVLWWCGYRFSLFAKKHWRQVYKALTVLEYLLTHGPDQLVMEFREDKARIDEFTRFVHVDENL